MRSTERVTADQWLEDNYESLISRVDTVVANKFDGLDSASAKREDLAGDILLLCIEMIRDGSLDSYEELTVALVVKCAMNRHTDNERRSGELSRGQGEALNIVKSVTSRLRNELGYEPNAQEVYDALPETVNRKQCRSVLFNGLPAMVPFELSTSNDNGDDTILCHDPVVSDDDEDEIDWNEYYDVIQDFVESLSETDRKVYEMRNSGSKNKDIASVTGLSASRVSQVVKRLTSDLNRLWGWAGYRELNVKRKKR